MRGMIDHGTMVMQGNVGIYGIINHTNDNIPPTVVITCIIAIGIKNICINLLPILSPHHFTEYNDRIDIHIPTTASIHEAMVMQSVMIPPAS